MKTKTFRLSVIFTAVILVAAGVGLTAYAKERKLTREEVPAAVLSNFQKTYPQAEVRGYEEEIEHGQTFFEIESTDGQTRRDILFKPTGEIAEIEETISKTDIPQLIQQTITAKFPEAEIRRVEKTTSHGKTFYEISFKQGDKHFAKEFDLQGMSVKE